MTRPAVDFVPTTDPLLRHPDLTHSVLLVVLGIETFFETNSAYVRDLVEETFGAWAGSCRPERSEGVGPEPRDKPLRFAQGDKRPVERKPASPSPDRVHVRIVVHDGSESTDVHAPVRYISTDDGRLIVHSPGSVAIVDESRRESLAYVTTALAADREHFRTTVVEAITFALLACFDRHPVHAAAIAAGDRALLLAGPSGMGKSTLAYLAHRARIIVLSDDRVWVQMEPTLRIWGTPSAARLTAAALPLFPELRDAGASAASGEKIVVPLPSATDGSSYTASRAVVCLLERGERAGLRPMAAADLSTELLAQLAPGFDRFPDRVDRVVKALTAGGGWRLTLTNDARDAMPFLRRMLEID